MRIPPRGVIGPRNLKLGRKVIGTVTGNEGPNPSYRSRARTRAMMLPEKVIPPVKIAGAANL